MKKISLSSIFSFVRRLLLVLTSLLPFSFLRIFVYRILFGYRISYASYIGPFSYINCKVFEFSGLRVGCFNYISVNNLFCDANTSIGRLNKLRYLDAFKMLRGSMILSRNTFTGTRDYFSPYESVFIFEMGIDSLVTNGHYFDCAGKISIGDNVVLGGKGTEVWTHGFDVNRTMIVGDVFLGNNIYIGSGVKILQGVTVCHDVSVGAGAIVSKGITQPGFYVSSSLVRKSDLPDYSNYSDVINYKNAKFFRK